ncbi:hypothetical protein ACHWQZ_G015000 [Mnemiopsis leidyi]
MTIGRLFHVDINLETQEEIQECLRKRHINYHADWASNASKSGGSLVSFRRRRRALVERDDGPSTTRQTSMVLRGSCDEYFDVLGSTLTELSTYTTNLTVGCSVNKQSVISCVYSYRLPSLI